MTKRYRIGIDVGGTFTDLFLLECESGAMVRHKLLSTPERPHLAPLQGLREILALAPLAIFIVWIGLRPDDFLSRMTPTLEAARQPAAAVVTRTIEPVEMTNAEMQRTNQ